MTRDGRILAIFAHPDDESLLAGGTLAACAAAGLEVAILCLTRGEQGPISHSDIATRHTLGAVREAELREAARALGVSNIQCLGYPDSELPWIDKAEIISYLAQAIASYQPDAIITFGPEGLYWHPDHIAVHEFTLAALGSEIRNQKSEIRTPWVYYATWPEDMVGRLAAKMEARGLATDLWGLEPDDFGARASSITTSLDVRPFIASKMRALRSHRSQLAEDHLFQTIPDDLAVEYLGHEYFVLAYPNNSEGDWLAEVLSHDGQLKSNRPSSFVLRPKQESTL